MSRQPRVVAGVVDAAVGRLVRHLLGLHVVALAHLDRVEPQLHGDDVDDPLGQPEVLHPRVAAVRRHRRLVRADLREVDADVLPRVAARGDLRPDDAAERLVAGKAPQSSIARTLNPVIVPSACTATSTSRNVRSLPCALAVCWSVRHSVHCTGRPSFLRQQAEDDVLGVEADLVSEAAADVCRDEAQLVDADAQRGRHPDRADARHLVVAVSVHCRFPCRTRRAPRRTRAASTRSGGSGASRSSRRDPPRRGPRRRRPSRRTPDQTIRACVVMQDGLVLQGVLSVDEDGELLVLHLDQLGRVARARAWLHRRPQPARPCGAPCRPRARVVLDRAPWRRRHLEERVGLDRDLVAGDRPVDALERKGCGDVDRDDPRCAYGERTKWT